MAAIGQGKQDWSSISAKAKKILLDSIPAEHRIPANLMPPSDQKDVKDFPSTSGFFTDRELEITNNTATTLVADLAKGRWSATEVIQAFMKRASVAHQLTNCLTTTMYSRAVERAAALDAHLARTGTPVGPLHGLPVSLKDNFNVRGFPTSVGLTAQALDPADKDDATVELLEAAGAVIYVKTTTPTALSSPECVNNTYGRTVNPANRQTTCGGSSGGEGALVAMGGSCLGTGSDIGGSVRIPAHCSGIFALRPSSTRFTYPNESEVLGGQEAILPVIGPMARSLGDLRLWSEAMVNSAPWLKDPHCVEIPWRAVTLPAKLRIGVIWDNGGVNKPTPPVTRALKTVVDRLRSLGTYEIVDWNAPVSHVEINQTFAWFFSADGARTIKEIIDETGEPLLPENFLIQPGKEYGVYDYWRMQKKRTDIRTRYLKGWVDSGIDALLGPTSVYVVPKNGEYKLLAYTTLFNLLDYSCISFPSGLKADKSLDAKMSDDESRNMDEVDAGVQKQYDPESVHGLPISLQLTAGRLQEEKVLAIAERILHDLKS